MKEKLYSEALAQAHSELEELLELRSAIDAKISRLKNTVEALTAQVEAQQHISETDEVLRSVGISFDESTGITDAIREVMNSSKVPLTAPQIRDALEARGYDIKQYSSILTVIHNTIKRMDKQGEIATLHDDTGGFSGWIHKSGAAARTIELHSLMRQRVWSDGRVPSGDKDKK